MYMIMTLVTTSTRMMKVTGFKWGWTESFPVGTGSDKNITILEVSMGRYMSISMMVFIFKPLIKER